MSINSVSELMTYRWIGNERYLRHEPPADVLDTPPHGRFGCPDFYSPSELAQYCASGLLTVVAMHDAQLEQDRDLLRSRQSLCSKGDGAQTHPVTAAAQRPSLHVSSDTQVYALRRQLLLRTDVLSSDDALGLQAQRLVPGNRTHRDSVTHRRDPERGEGTVVGPLEFQVGLRACFGEGLALATSVLGFENFETRNSRALAGSLPLRIR